MRHVTRPCRKLWPSRTGPYLEKCAPHAGLGVADRSRGLPPFAAHGGAVSFFELGGSPRRSLGHLGAVKRAVGCAGVQTGFHRHHGEVPEPTQHLPCKHRVVRGIFRNNGLAHPDPRSAGSGRFACAAGKPWKAAKQQYVAQRHARGTDELALDKINSVQAQCLHIDLDQGLRCRRWILCSNRSAGLAPKRSRTHEPSYRRRSPEDPADNTVGATGQILEPERPDSDRVTRVMIGAAL